MKAREWYFNDAGLSEQFKELSMWVVRAAASFNRSAPAITQGVQIRRLEDFTRVSKRALARVKNVGPGTIREIETLLTEKGLELLP